MNQKLKIALTERPSRHTKNQQEWQKTPFLAALVGSMLQFVHLQDDPGTETGQFHPPRPKVCSCTSPT